jgi:hypothetical protein
MGVKLVASSGGSVELVPTNTASNFTVTVPAKTGTMAMDGPAFSAYASSATSLSTATWTKITFDGEIFDTNSNFASSRFTPTIAGYYQVSSSWQSSFTSSFGGIAFYKNGSLHQYGAFISATPVGVQTGAGTLIYCNGSTDYIEVYAYQATGSTQNISSASSPLTWFTGAMVRAA